MDIRGWKQRIVLWLFCAGVIVGGIWGGMQMGKWTRGDSLPTAGPAVLGATVLGAPVMAQEAPAPFQNGLLVDGRVLPVRQTSLGFTISGTLLTLEVAEGDEVEAGQVLARLDSAQQQTAVSRAQADLARAQARLDELRAGVRMEEIQSAEAGLAAAQARLQRVESGSLPNDTAAAQASVAAAQANLRRVMEGPSEQELIGARAEMANAEAAVRQAQAAYDEVRWRPDIGALPQAADLERATNNFAAAQARLADLESGVRQADIDAANAEVRRASAQLAQLQATLPADVAAAQADVRQFEAQLALLLAGTRPEQIVAAEAEVAGATAALQQALVGVAQTELRAPIDGEVVQLDFSLGEQVQPGATVIQLADLSEWEIRTEDLTELDVVGVTAGERVEIRFDAIPGLMLPGEVVRVRPVGTDQRGDIVYTVIIRPLASDSRLLWNMTAVVTFVERG